MPHDEQLPLVSVVVPVYQNAASLADLQGRLQQVTSGIGDVAWEFIFVDDGSTDDSLKTLEALLKHDSRIRIVRLSRNFGSQAAILAGLSQAAGQAAAIISADLQDPPELLDSMLGPWRSGTKVVLAARARRDDPWPARLGAALFYWLFRRLALANMPPGGFDCCLLDRQVVDLLATLRRPSFLPGEILCLGFRHAMISYERKPRLAKYGRSMWTFAKRVRFAVEAIWTFSRTPLRLVWGLGCALSLLAAAMLCMLLIRPNSRFEHGIWFVVIAGGGGLQILSMSCLGESIWRCQQTMRNRPAFIIDQVIATSPRKPFVAAHHENSREPA